VTLTAHPLLVPWSWKSRAIPLLPLWAIRPVQILSACTRVRFTFYLPYDNTLEFISHLTVKALRQHYKSQIVTVV